MKKTIFLSLIFVIGLKISTAKTDYILKPATLVYIILPDTTSETSKKYMEIYKKYWTFSKYKYITPNEKDMLNVPGNLFLGFTFNKRKDYNSRSFKEELIYMQVSFSLFEYVVDTDIKGKGKEINYREQNIYSIKIPVKNIDFYDKLINGNFHIGSSYALDTFEYNFGNNLFFWCPGVLKNYIQKIAIQTSKKAAITEDDITPIDDPNSVTKLSTKVLYFPEYCLMDYSLMTNTYKEEMKDEKKIFEKYTFDYEILNKEELNKKILESEEEFYYVIYINDNPRKYVNIVSSKTGKIIYSVKSTPSYEFNKGDIKDLMKAINGG